MISSFIPNKIKLKKTFHPKKLRVKKYSDTIIFGKYGIKVQKDFKLNKIQLESLNKTISKLLKKCGKTWFRVFPHFFETKKPLEVRMGNGKGNFNQWVVEMRKGLILLEFSIDTNKENALFLSKIKKILASKVGSKCKLIYIDDIY